MRNKLKIISCLTLVMLCVTSFSITAFASGGDMTETDAVSQDTTGTTEPTEVVEEIPYTYTINDDGSIVITINGETVTTEETVTGGKVTTNGGRLNLRTGAGMSYEIIDRLRCGEEVTVIGTEGDWYEVIVPEKRGYVHSNYVELFEKAQQNSEIDSAMLTLIFQMMMQNIPTEAPDYSFTPDGNLTLIDDFFQIEQEATEDTEQKDKQFITLQSKNGNYFYLVIDRNGETENVYFLNLVDEADLMTLIKDAEDGTKVPTCSCTDKCAIGAIKTDCEICRTNMSECVGKEPVVEEPEPTDPAEEPTEENTSVNFLPIIILVIAGAAGGAVYWFKFKKQKPKTSGNSDLDDYDYGQDDDDYDEETEIDDADLLAEAESEKE